MTLVERRQHRPNYDALIAFALADGPPIEQPPAPPPSRGGWLPAQRTKETAMDSYAPAPADPQDLAELAVLVESLTGLVVTLTERVEALERTSRGYRQHPVATLP